MRKRAMPRGAPWDDPADTSPLSNVYSVLMFWACVRGVGPGDLFEVLGGRVL